MAQADRPAWPQRGGGTWCSWGGSEVGRCLRRSRNNEARSPCSSVASAKAAEREQGRVAAEPTAQCCAVSCGSRARPRVASPEAMPGAQQRVAFAPPRASSQAIHASASRRTTTKPATSCLGPRSSSPKAVAAGGAHRRTAPDRSSRGAANPHLAQLQPPLSQWCVRAGLQAVVQRVQDAFRCHGRRRVYVPARCGSHTSAQAWASIRRTTQ